LKGQCHLAGVKEDDGDYDTEDDDDYDKENDDDYDKEEDEACSLYLSVQLRRSMAGRGTQGHTEDLIKSINTSPYTLK
jgi:hypothetical protein